MKYIPRKTQQKLENPPPPGTRHSWMITVGIPLIGNGWTPDEVFNIFRSKFPAAGAASVSDAEINAIVDGIMDYDPAPSIPRKKGARKTETRPESASKDEQPVKVAAVASPETAIESFLGGFRISEEEVLKLSPVIFVNPADQMAVFLLKLFSRLENLNIVTDYKEVDGKGIPKGAGITESRAYWCRQLRESLEVPSDEAGAWIRINPMDGEWIKNENVASFRHALLEMDHVPLDLQLAFFCRVELPVVALVKSGANSIHCWIKVDATDLEDYRTQVGACYELLSPFGIDPSNKNPSRLARLPGAKRVIGAVGDGIQKLLYLNPNPNPDGIMSANVKEIVCP